MLVHALAGLAQHPADRLVDEVVRVVQQPPGDGAGGPVGARAGGGEGGQDRDAPLPHAPAVRERDDPLGQGRGPGRAVGPPDQGDQEPGAHEVLGRGVHQVPVVDQAPPRPVQVAPPQLLAPGQGGAHGVGGGEGGLDGDHGAPCGSWGRGRGAGPIDCHCSGAECVWETLDPASTGMLGREEPAYVSARVWNDPGLAVIRPSYPEGYSGVVLKTWVVKVAVTVHSDESSSSGELLQGRPGAFPGVMRGALGRGGRP